MWLFLAFLLVPLIEIALFIEIGGLIGLWPTLAIVVLTAIAGTWLVRAQGRMAIGRLKSSFERLDDPTQPLADAAMILVSGALLLTPGFFTDAVGFALLAPPVRHAVFRWARKRVVMTRFEMGSAPQGDPRMDPRYGGPQNRRPRDTVIEGEFTEVSNDKTPNHPGSGWTRH
jgi:UPF0716 protein FxsA